MSNKYKMITLCGSAKFKEDFLRVQQRLTLDGNIVLLPVFFDENNNITWTEERTRMLKEMHLKKIELSDEIFVINSGGYVGDSTKNEIAHALALGKTVEYMEK